MRIQYSDEHCTVFESALYRTTSSIIHTDDLVLLVDPNYFPIELECIKEKLQEVRGEKPVYLFYTHSDFDHIVGSGAFKNVKTIISESFANNPEKETTISKIQEMDDDFYILRDYNLHYPKGDIIISQTHHTLIVGETSVHFYQAPGHNRDSLFAVAEPFGIWICGDYLSNIEFPFIYHSYKEYLNTMERAEKIMNEHDIRIMIPGHGDLTSSQQEMHARINESNTYLHDLTLSISSGKSFEEEKLWKKYKFPISMKNYHLENLELVRKELKKG